MTRAVVVVHGTGRNADEYYDSMLRTATDAGAERDTVIIAPRFQTDEDSPADSDACSA
ncbi:hypothetical protein EV193_102115 [Herbihabitans rhizosphaerae]|uniref:Alpha/beta hydrolase family protein n=1 Tax=Herbihabitans rhizosphaerae TaxID=1872711 RepID=A0A4Q7L0Z0_9PSEU|nr:hypothetical protein [Herbihabitans rhizosphaerae]RZS43139.1 hypothetical protein EV193_102115 [Herbihabitans rhizosphaerae]